MLRNCIRCEKMFSHPSQKICPACHREEQEEFRKVSDYLKENPKAPVGKVVEDTEVSYTTIEEYIREGRLKVIPTGITLQCQVCGKDIRSGRMCDACRTHLQTGSTKPDSVPDKHDPQSGKVHLLRKIRDREDS